MTRTSFLSISALAAMVMTTVSLALAQSPIEGEWVGTVLQNDGSPGYPMVLKISATEASTDYPDTNCSGRLERVASTGPYVIFTETITSGRVDQGGMCIDGTITVAPNGERLGWGWFGVFNGQVITAYSDMTRQSGESPGESRR